MNTNTKYKIATMCVLGVLSNNAFACMLQAPNSAPSYITGEAFNYKILNNEVVMADIKDRSSGHTYNHIVPKSKLYALLNQSMQMAKNEPIYREVKAKMQNWANHMGHKLGQDYQNAISDYFVGGEESIGEGGACPAALNNVIGWLPGNLFLSPPSETRSWDPGSKFDTWAGESTLVRTELYNSYKDMNVESINGGNYKKFLNAFMKMIETHRKKPFQEDVHIGKPSTIWVYGPQNALQDFKKSICPPSKRVGTICSTSE